jgi:2-polyprenyl-6-methoxyphenol hydroxylase-like FAD-dependent oxidoreductase
MLAFEQSKNEELLASRLLNDGIKIHWKYEFIELKEYKNSISAITSHEGEKFEIKSKYLIACDGANSTVRQQLNFSFKGGTYTHKFFVADTKLEWDQPYNNLIIAPGDKNFCAFLPLYGDLSYRVIGSLPQRFFNKEDITFSDIEDIIIHTLGVKVKFQSVNWFSTYKLHHRRADHFREGNVFLAGDSAHIHSPAGGQGMNTGLQDAYNICWKLAMMLKGCARPSLLETYNEERLPFARWLIQFTDRGFNLMTSDNWFIKVYRKYIMLNMVGFVPRIGWLRPIMFKVLSQIWYSYAGRSLSASVSKQKLKFKAGDRLPFLENHNIYPELTNASFHLVHIHSDRLDEAIQKKIFTLFPFHVKIVECQPNTNWTKLGVFTELFILLRPDNYIAFIFDKLDRNDIHTYLRRHFNS